MLVFQNGIEPIFFFGFTHFHFLVPDLVSHNGIFAMRVFDFIPRTFSDFVEVSSCAINYVIKEEHFALSFFGRVITFVGLAHFLHLVALSEINGPPY